MQYLDVLPEEVLEKILKNLTSPVDLDNCSNAHPRLKEELGRKSISKMLPQVLPLIAKFLGVKDTLKISSVCHDWKGAVENFDDHVPGRHPYNDQILLHHMKTLGKDPSEHKWKTDVWFSFIRSGRDLKSFSSVLKNHPEKVPFAIGKSAYFEISHKDYRVQSVYLFYLQNFLKKYGHRFYYVKLRFTENYSLQYRQDFQAIGGVLENIPNARHVEIEGNVTNRVSINITQEEETAEMEKVLIPPLPLLESLSLSLGMDSTRRHEGNAVATHANQLKKLKLTARSGNLPKEMPSLVELYLQGIYSEEFFHCIKKLDAPLLQKLTLEIANNFCFRRSEWTDLVGSCAHLSLRQLIIKCPTGNSHVHRIFHDEESKLGKLEFLSVHTLTIYNFPDDWLSFLAKFPFLRYLNIRVTNPDAISMDAREILQKRDELRIKRLLYGENEEFVKLPEGTNDMSFFSLKQISVEMWENYGGGEPGKLLHSKIWTRNPKTCYSFNESIK